MVEILIDSEQHCSCDGCGGGNPEIIFAHIARRQPKRASGQQVLAAKAWTPGYSEPIYSCQKQISFGKRSKQFSEGFLDIELPNNFFHTGLTWAGVSLLLYN